jgi:hypothetical protein
MNCNDCLLKFIDCYKDEYGFYINKYTNEIIGGEDLFLVRHLKKRCSKCKAYLCVQCNNRTIRGGKIYNHCYDCDQLFILNRFNPF